MFAPEKKQLFPVGNEVAGPDFPRNESVLHRTIDGMKEKGLLTTEGGYWIALKKPGIEKIRLALEETMPF